MVWFPVYTKGRLGGGGAGKFFSWQIVFSMSSENLFSGISMQKYLFSSATKFGKSKKKLIGGGGGGVRLNDLDQSRGGGRNVS